MLFSRKIGLHNNKIIDLQRDLSQIFQLEATMGYGSFLTDLQGSVETRRFLSV